jgi:hypothetical protein
LLILEMQSKGASRFLFNPKPTRCFGVQVSHRVAQLAGDIAAARGGGVALGYKAKFRAFSFVGPPDCDLGRFWTVIGYRRHMNAFFVTEDAQGNPKTGPNPTPTQP